MGEKQSSQLPGGELSHLKINIGMSKVNHRDNLFSAVFFLRLFITAKPTAAMAYAL